MSKQELSPKQVWSCDERYPRNPGKCRNSHGCHCKEIATLLSQVRQKDEALRNIEARLALRAKCELDGGDFRYMEGQIEAALSPAPQPNAAQADKLAPGCCSATTPCNHQKWSPNTLCPICDTASHLPADDVIEAAKEIAYQVLLGQDYDRAAAERHSAAEIVKELAAANLLRQSAPVEAPASPTDAAVKALVEERDQLLEQILSRSPSNVERDNQTIMGINNCLLVALRECARPFTLMDSSGFRAGAEELAVELSKRQQMAMHAIENATLAQHGVK